MQVAQGILTCFHHQSHGGRQEDVLTVTGKGVGRLALTDLEIEGERSVGGRDRIITRLRTRHQGYASKA